MRCRGIERTYGGGCHDHRRLRLRLRPRLFPFLHTQRRHRRFFCFLFFVLFASSAALFYLFIYIYIYLPLFLFFFFLVLVVCELQFFIHSRPQLRPTSNSLISGPLYCGLFMSMYGVLDPFNWFDPFFTAFFFFFFKYKERETGTILTCCSLGSHF